MSVARVFVAAVFGVLFAILLVVRLAATRERQRALRDLPPNTSNGVPVLSVQRERRLAFLLCVFVLSIVSWLTFANT